MLNPVDRIERTDVRERRLSAVGACCATLGCAFLLLAACSTPTPRPTPISALPPVAPPTPVADVAPLAVLPTPPLQPVSPWPRLRQRYAMPGCDYSPTVRQFAAAMAANPGNLSAALKAAMPFLLLVTDQIEKYNLPGEFAFLPWVESSYTMLPGHGGSVAGMWQLMPLTAQENGLHIDADYDGRLDVVASSRAALSLIKQYKETFGDWRLANMAFNAGEGSIRSVMGKRASMPPTEIERLRLNKTNHEHLTKLLAVACIVSAPERYHVQLPEPSSSDLFVQLELPAPLDLHLAAKLAGMEFSELQRLNPAYLKGRMPERGPFHLLVPANRRTAMESTLGMMPQYAWRNWHEIKLQQPQSVDMLSMAYDVDAAALAQINRIDKATTMPSGTRLMLPDRAVDVPAPTVLAATSTPNAAAAVSTSPVTLTTAHEETCTVRPGDTLWNIANRYGVRVEDLVHWNRLTRSATLQLGQKLVLSAPAG